jgi:cation:H+ antiporter
VTALLAEYPLGYSIGLFLFAAGVVGIFGVRMTYLARDLAAATGMGEAFTGAVFIGATTSLSGIIASATAAWHGEAGMAVSNSLGGIAAQTLFLVLADMLYRKANLEFAAASVENMMMSVQLAVLFAILLIAFTLPGFEVYGVHPASIVLVVAYLFTLKLLVDAHEKPMWLPRMTQGTVSESRRDSNRPAGSVARLFFNFALCAGAVGVAGWLLAGAGMVIVGKTGLSSGIVGGIFIAVATSLPELVVAVTAIRLGALTLAVGDIVGGNAFDTLFVAVSDLFYRPGSIYASIETTEHIWLGSAMLMNAVLLMGLMYRQRRGIANIGMESALIGVIYLCTVVFLGAHLTGITQG